MDKKSLSMINFKCFISNFIKIQFIIIDFLRETPTCSPCQASVGLAAEFAKMSLWRSTAGLNRHVPPCKFRLRRGKSLTWILHHSSGSSSPSMMGNCKYLFISFFNWSRGDCAGEAGWICDNFRMLVREPSVFFTFNGGGWHDLSSDSSSITNVTASLLNCF